MDWNTLATALVGGIGGGAVTGAVSFVQMRSGRRQGLQARRWIDAEVVADAKQLLMELNPQRRTMNLDPAPGAEAELWKGLNKRRDDLYRQLLLLAGGHPSEEVAAAANELGLGMLWTAQQSQFAVSELLANRMNLKLIEAAQERHETAEATAVKLEIAIKKAAVPKRRLLGKRRPALVGQASAPGGQAAGA